MRATVGLRILLIATALFATVNDAQSQEARDSILVSAISDPRHAEISEGKIVWVDLVTTDVRAASDFYSAVFSWDAVPRGDGSYVEFYHDGILICAIADFDEGGANNGDARWLISMSVLDVDSAVRTVVERGGKILEPPADLPARGRFAVVQDNQGALLMLLRATGGDPVDEQLGLDRWAWAELWTHDVDRAQSFYSALANFDVVRVPGDERRILGRSGEARASVVRLPWPEVAPNWIPYIPVADIGATLRKVEAAGGVKLVASSDADGGPSAAVVMDPTGGVFALQQAALKP
jgi:predicted enzyme related to lactoylglutathione lyase